MTTTFKKYSSIENHYQKEYMERILCTPEVETTKFCCLEKVHGSNFSFHVSEHGDKIQCAKRTAMLQDDSEKELDPFFPVAVKQVRAKYTCCAKKLFEIISNLYKKKEEHGQEMSIDKIIIFGELFGGAYKGIPTQHKQAPIQKEIHYCPTFEFFAFDIFVQRDAEAHFWIPTVEAIDLFEQSGFQIHAKPLFIGSLKECLAFDTEFETTIPAQFFSELQPLGVEHNICEGIIIKPWDTVMYDIKRNRIVIKKKNAKFFEKVMPNADKQKRIGNAVDALAQFDSALQNEKVKQFVQEMSCYLTDARIASVISKIGSVDANTHSRTLDKIAGLWIQDAVEECRKENSAMWEKEFLEKDLRKLAMKHVTQMGMKQFYTWFQKNYS